jgi:hypothetical protein
LQQQIWDDGAIYKFMTRNDTRGLCIEDGMYKLICYIDCNEATILKEAEWAFRILRFLGAGPGFTITWWRINKPRVLGPNMFPTRAEVNGGWAYKGGSAVWIFRLEEWDRVLIHECVHALNWDVLPSENVKSCLEKSVSGSLTDALFEAATEFLAEWFWCIIHSPENDYSGETWIRQKEWQLKQTYQILARRSQKWSEDTSVFAYYVLKSALAQEDDGFLISWYSNKADPEHWCQLWQNYKNVFYHKAELYKNSVNMIISMRMSCPDLELKGFTVLN